MKGKGHSRKLGAAKVKKGPQLKDAWAEWEELLEESELRGVGAGRVGAEEELEREQGS